VHGLRLIAGNSVKPIPEAHVDKASGLFRRYMKEMTRTYWNQYMSFTHHNFLHLVDDVRAYHCHLDRNSAYVFENFH
jgi:hypothetical protein